MKITLKRIQLDPDVTIGALYVNDVLQCYTCEDVERLNGPKVFGETAIPRGSYDITINYSEHFKRPLPLLLGVPNYSGVRIHTGNVPADTEGCILPGLDRLPKSVGRSVLAFNTLFAQIQNAIVRRESVSIQIVGP